VLCIRVTLHTLITPSSPWRHHMVNAAQVLDDPVQNPSGSDQAAAHCPQGSISPHMSCLVDMRREPSKVPLWPSATAIGASA